MGLKEALAAAATIGFGLAVVSWPAWIIFRNKSTEVRDALLHKYVDILRQLQSISELRQEFNEVCANRSLAARLEPEDFDRFVALTNAAFHEINGSPPWKVCGKYPKYWHHAEIHAQYFAPLEGQLRATLRELTHAAAP